MLGLVKHPNAPDLMMNVARIMICKIASTFPLTILDNPSGGLSAIDAAQAKESHNCTELEGRNNPEPSDRRLTRSRLSTSVCTSTSITPLISQVTLGVNLVSFRREQSFQCQHGCGCPLT